MALGPGKYDAILTKAREQAKAESGVLIILGGAAGDGFSIQGTAEVIATLPVVLRMIANDIEKDLMGLWTDH
jgi:hypothetical protein